MRRPCPQTCSAGHLRCPVSVFFTGGNPGTPPCGLRSRFQARGPLWLMERREPQSPALPPRLPQAGMKAAPWPCGARAAARKAVGSGLPTVGMLTAQAGLEKLRSRAWAVCSLLSAIRSLPSALCHPLSATCAASRLPVPLTTATEDKHRRRTLKTVTHEQRPETGHTLKVQTTQVQV